MVVVSYPPPDSEDLTLRSRMCSVPQRGMWERVPMKPGGEAALWVGHFVLTALMTFFCPLTSLLRVSKEAPVAQLHQTRFGHLLCAGAVTFSVFRRE